MLTRSSGPRGTRVGSLFAIPADVSRQKCTRCRRNEKPTGCCTVPVLPKVAAEPYKRDCRQLSSLSFEGGISASKIRNNSIEKFLQFLIMITFNSGVIQLSYYN